MSVKYSPKSRRQFLVGAGRSALLLPMLPSLLSRELLAATAVAPRRFMLLSLMHYTPNTKWLNPALATTPVGTFGAAKEVVLSTMTNPNLPVLGHPLYTALRTAGKMTILNGVDTLVDTAGHGSQAGGLLSGSLQYSGNEYYPGGLYPSIDTVMESSPTLYPPATSGSMTKVVRADIADSQWMFQSMKRVGNSVQPVAGFSNPLALYNSVFAQLTPGTPADNSFNLKKSILDSVFASYTSVRSGRQISAQDKLRLDEHLQMISDLQATYGSPPTTISCTKPNSPGSGLTYPQSVQMSMSLLAIAMKCGLTKIGLLGASGHNQLGIPGLPNIPYHNDIVHSSMSEVEKFNHFQTYAKFHLDSLADHFLAPLNVEEGTTGKTYLENMLTVLCHEHGLANAGQGENHPNYNHMVVFFGNMGGILRSDRMICFKKGSVGVSLNQLLLTYMYAMGIPASEYEAVALGGKGFGPYGPGGSITPPASYASAWGQRLFQPIEELIA